ncbi:hypothetical protein FB567DRAFT_619452 [Paraphoma chrysanthemicola]|uniref:Uncharacterized protein n=1 Tax=Paraphoma chrysanthemicola TaxID=798071 RepID=A0A8K0VZ45_9PLEO|nr:hypothetical protein FB567DRAFT_619452 [Paraphoma chrysanthemicola]
MDPAPFDTGFTPDAHTRLPTLDESNDVARRVHSYLPPPSTHGSFPNSISRGLSPLNETTALHLGHAGDDRSRYTNLGQHFSHAVFTPTRLNHPPTPPEQSDEFDLLRKWHMEQGSEEPHLHNRATPQDASIMRTHPSILQSYDQNNILTLPQISTVFGEWNRTPTSQSIQQPLSTSGHARPVQQATSQQWSPNADGVYYNQGQFDLDQPQYVNQSQNTSMQSLPVNPYSRTLPLPPQLQSTMVQSPYQPAPHTPSVQQWPTSHLLNQPSTRQLTRQPKASKNAPSPGYDGRVILDKKTQTKQEAFQKKAEERRRKRQAMAASKASQPRPRKTSNTGGVKRRLSSGTIDLTTPTTTPSLRPPQVPGYHPPAQSYGYVPPSKFLQPPGYVPVYGPGPISSPLARTLTPPPPPPINHDSQPQAIVREYEDYKWSATLYEVEHKDQYDFAQAWLEDLLKINLNKEHKWHTHTTQGFIPGGDRFSLLVLHNAADPFEWGPASESTSTIGVYGAHWYEHEDIHWKTLSPGIDWLLNWCLAQGGISIKKKWRSDEPNAREKRFHRAYWLAANMRDLKGLLNHGMSSDAPHDAVDKDFDDEFEVSEEGLTWGGWTDDVGEDGVKGELDEEESLKAWSEILETNDENGDEGGVQHVVTGSSEWM